MRKSLHQADEGCWMVWQLCPVIRWENHYWQ